MLECPPHSKGKSKRLQPQRPPGQYLPVGLLAVIRILARRTGGNKRLIVFGPQPKKQ